MTWRLAKSLETLRDQINKAYPKRNKSSDGTIGDDKHAATKSEHNPDGDGVVRALDITNDPSHGLDSRKLAEQLVESRDPRILYIISNGQIISSKVQPWVWRKYTGVNSHEEHVHISVVADPKLYDDTRLWLIGKIVDVIVATLPGRFTKILATEFGGATDPQESAYGGRVNGDAPEVALPCRLSNDKRLVRVFYGDKSVICNVTDVGPWNTKDDYPLTGNRPLVESQFAEGKKAQNKRKPTNTAGIDMTPAVWEALGIPGRGKEYVDWEFVIETKQSIPQEKEKQEMPWYLNMFINSSKVGGWARAATSAILTAGSIYVAAKLPFLQGILDDATIATISAAVGTFVSGLWSSAVKDGPATVPQQNVTVVATTPDVAGASK